ncbi:late secretory pathway protein avl9 [Schaereria dolodes]|nr:late secretory pathway protein avl9 [Schaereria dolodes]
MSSRFNFKPIVCVVGFHHARGPEIESWFGIRDGSDPAVDNDWSFLPFMALSDGAHASTEDFSYFTLQQRERPDGAATSLFGISCTRQLDANELLNRPAEVTRSTVQKAVVVIANSPQLFGSLREKLSVVTTAWFAQNDFTDVDILKRFQESLEKTLQDTEDDRDQYLGKSSISFKIRYVLTIGAGLSLRELIHEFKYQTLILFKCCLLQSKMLFFGSRCERLCMMQFSLISLIPGLLRRLEDCADPGMESYGKNLVMPTSLKTSERSSLLAYMGLPLQIFGKGSLFGPYTPLQQLDTLADFGTKSYIVGSTNPLLLQQKDRYSDILINLDENTINITSNSLRYALSLSIADRRWIDFLTQTVTETWDDANPSRPKTLGYMGSEEFIRLQFEEYLLALLSCVKYHLFLYADSWEARKDTLTDVEGDPALDFNIDWIDAWRQTSNFELFNRYTDSHLFDIVEPRHPTAGGLSMDDINRRLTQQIQELHLDERLATSKVVLNKHLATGQKKVSTAFNNLWADIEVMREAQRNRHAEQKMTSLGLAPSSANASTAALPSPSTFSISDTVSSPERTPTSTTTSTTDSRFDTSALRSRAPDLSHAQASVSAAGQKASAYISSWGSWASERRKGWTKGRAGDSVTAGSNAGEVSAGVTRRRTVDEKGEERGIGRRASAGKMGPGKRKEERGGDGIGRLDA